MPEIELGLDAEHQWCRSFLSGLADYPCDGQRTVGQLINWYDSWMSINLLIEGRDTAEYYYEFNILNKTGSVSDAYFNNHPDEARERISSSVDSSLGTPRNIRKTTLRQNLENDSKIGRQGKNRGRKYRWLTARTPLPDGVISDLIIEILSNLQRAETWEGLFGYVEHVMLEFHKSLDNESYDRNQGDPITGTTPVLIKGNPELDLASFPFDINLFNICASDIKSETDTSEFCKNTYDYKWFTKSSSNLQRYLRESGKVVTSTPENTLKRGEWCHVDHVKLKVHLDYNIFKEMDKLTNDIISMRTKFQQQQEDYKILMMTLERALSELREHNEEPNKQ